MIWLAIRQFRRQALIAAVALAALAVLVAVLGAQLLSDYHATVTGCAAHADCFPATTALVNRFDRWNTWFGVVVLVVPGLLGIFWGAPLLARARLSRRGRSDSPGRKASRGLAGR